MYRIAQNFGGGNLADLVDLSKQKIFPTKFLNMTMYTILDKPVVLDSPILPCQLYV